MPRYKIKTTVDITRSNPDRGDPDQIRQAQQSNFNTLLQGIGMRANVEWTYNPSRSMLETEGKIAYWLWEFTVEREDVFLSDGDPVGLLKQDLHGVPIIKNLTETETFPKACFIIDKNIWIEKI
tara:strand:+ start:1900 stop:2271 length:372 start_codon:yes stop_codon:yes gene_type:complete